MHRCMYYKRQEYTHHLFYSSGNVSKHNIQYVYNMISLMQAHLKANVFHAIYIEWIISTKLSCQKAGGGGGGGGGEGGGCRLKRRSRRVL